MGAGRRRVKSSEAGGEGLWPEEVSVVKAEVKSGVAVAEATELFVAGRGDLNQKTQETKITESRQVYL